MDFPFQNETIFGESRLSRDLTDRFSLNLVIVIVIVIALCLQYALKWYPRKFLELLAGTPPRGVGMIFFMGGPNSKFFGASRQSLHFRNILRRAPKILNN